MSAHPSAQMTKFTRLAEILGRVSHFIPVSPGVGVERALRLNVKCIAVLSLIDALQMVSGHCTQKDLVLAFDRWLRGDLDRVGLNFAPAVTELLARLKKEGLIEHVRSVEDHRSKQIRLTAWGRTFLDQVHAARGGHLAELAMPDELASELVRLGEQLETLLWRRSR